MLTRDPVNFVSLLSAPNNLPTGHWHPVLETGFPAIFVCHHLVASVLGVDSPFLSAIVLFKNQPFFPAVFVVF